MSDGGVGGVCDVEKGVTTAVAVVTVTIPTWDKIFWSYLSVK